MSLSGYEKAATFLSAVGEETAAKIMKNLESEHISKLSACMKKDRNIDRNEVEGIFNEISEKIKAGIFQVGGADYFRDILTKGLGNEDAQKILELSCREDPMDSVKKINPQTLSNFLVTEHPQTIAMILCVLEPEQAAQVMSFLPDELRSNVTMRIASTDSIPESAIAEIGDVLKLQLDVGEEKEGKKFNGTKVIAEILNHCERKLEQNILENLEENNAELAESIQEIMFVFDDIENVDDKGIQAILKEVSTEDLSLALKTATDTLKEKIFTNMSKRAATLLKEEMEAKGPVRVSEVEAAQRNIVKVARKLEEDGMIVISGRGKEEFVE